VQYKATQDVNKTDCSTSSRSSLRNLVAWTRNCTT